MPKRQPVRHPLEVARLRAQLSNAQAAAKLGVNQETVRRWERGERMPRQSTLVRIARLYCVRDTLDLYPTE